MLLVKIESITSNPDVDPYHKRWTRAAHPVFAMKPKGDYDEKLKKLRDEIKKPGKCGSLFGGYVERRNGNAKSLVFLYADELTEAATVRRNYASLGIYCFGF